MTGAGAGQRGVTGEPGQDLRIHRVGRHHLLPLRPLGVADHHRDGRAHRQTVPHPAEEGDLVLLELHPGTAPIAEPPPRQVVRHQLRGDRHARGKALQRRDECGAVGLPRGQPAQPAQRCSSYSRPGAALRTRVLAYGVGVTGCAALARHLRSSHVPVGDLVAGPASGRRPGSGRGLLIDLRGGRSGVWSVRSQGAGAPSWRSHVGVSATRRARVPDAATPRRSIRSPLGDDSRRISGQPVPSRPPCAWRPADPGCARSSAPAGAPPGARAGRVR